MMEHVKTWIALIVIGACVLGTKSCVDSQWYSDQQAEFKAQKRAAATPHVIREADGCKVYAFASAGRTHYFTRCGSTVTTERTGSESCGKACTRPTSEVIVTEGNKP